MPSSLPIGVFDSGLGGLTVVREVLRQLPRESVHYFADTAHVPYGPRPAAEILQFAEGILHHFRRSGVKAVVAACNLSSAVAIDRVAPEVGFPVIGVIRPGVRAGLAALREGERAEGRPALPPSSPASHSTSPDRPELCGMLGILATEGTVRSEAYPREVARLAPRVTVHQVACPSFVPLVESGKAESEEALQAARLYAEPLRQAGIRTVILGCTHYPYLLPVLRQAMPEARFVDPAEAAVTHLAQVLAERGLVRAESTPPRHRFEASADPQRLQAGVRHWLGLSACASLRDLWTPSGAPSKWAPAAY